MSFDDDAYGQISCEVIVVRDMAVLLRTEDGKKIWVPRSLLWGGDDLALKDMTDGDEREFRIREWWLKKEGLV